MIVGQDPIFDLEAFIDSLSHEIARLEIMGLEPAEILISPNLAKTLAGHLSSHQLFLIEKIMGLQMVRSPYLIDFDYRVVDRCGYPRRR